MHKSYMGTFEECKYVMDIRIAQVKDDIPLFSLERYQVESSMKEFINLLDLQGEDADKAIEYIMNNLYPAEGGN